MTLIATPDQKKTQQLSLTQAGQHDAALAQRIAPLTLRTMTGWGRKSAANAGNSATARRRANRRKV